MGVNYALKYTSETNLATATDTEDAVVKAIAGYLRCVN